MLQLSLQSQLTGAQASAGAAAQGFITGQSGEFYYKFENNNGIDFTERAFTTSRDNIADVQFGKLKVQNLNDTAGILITKVTLILTGDLLEHGPFGFTDAKKPANTKPVNIPQGEILPIPLFAGNKIGGKGSDRPDPNKTGVFYNASARTYTGSIQVEVMYSDGTIEKGDILPWILKKNKKSI